MLQWATYRDASDQCSLSRIWGGIHPPTDDIKGRIIGETIGPKAYNLALDYFNGTLGNDITDRDFENTTLFPNPIVNTLNIRSNYNGKMHIIILGVDGKQVYKNDVFKEANTISFDTQSLPSGFYFVKLMNENNTVVSIKKVIKS